MRSNSKLLLVLLLAPGLSACGEPASPPAVAAADAGGRIAFSDPAATRVSVETGPLPARYAAALPTTSAELRDWWEDDKRFPPIMHATDGIASGDAGWIARLRRSADAVPAADAGAWAEQWRQRLQYRTLAPAFCESVRKIAAEPDSNLRRALMPAFAQECATLADAPVVLRADTPDLAVLAYYDLDSMRAGPPPAFDPRLERAARALMQGDDELQARSAAFVMAELRQPEATAALERLHTQLSAQGAESQERADHVAMAFAHSDSRIGQTQLQLACSRRVDDPICTQLRKPSKPEAAEVEPSKADPARVRARIEQLQAMGFTRVVDADPSALEGADVVSVLMAAGYAHWFDVETGQFPNAHDSLLRELAALVRPSLSGVVFEEIAPEDDEGPYQLVAYADGKIYRTRAENQGDWYDVDAVLRLLDTLLQARKSADRFLPLGTGDQTLIVVGGPRAAIDAALAQKLLTPGDPAESERAGKAFEAQVLEQLGKEKKAP
ncbi:hypothetical protein [Lysobacter silvisoli]|uniref:SMI1/KNR4 family protein n=1 Tax=Lysobacter silvisoli TaxID=2293254 RepID=A0A371K1D8_9GAMM|nr:hypothetical protein [Lysobacter silvisoli]RDZ27741.1 hypothetical protein DX914_00765 [Lysobacter silvisoli]